VGMAGVPYLTTHPRVTAALPAAR